MRLGKKVREWSHLGPQQAWPCYPDLRARKVMLMWIQVYQPGSRTHTGFFALSKRVLMKTGKVLLSSRNCNKGSAVHVKSCQMLSSDGGKYTGHMKWSHFTPHERSLATCSEDPNQAHCLSLYIQLCRNIAKIVLLNIIWVTFKYLQQGVCDLCKLDVCTKWKITPTPAIM